MRNPVQFLDTHGKQIRTVIGPDGGSWFVLVDLCAALDLRNASQVSKRLDPADVAMTRLDSKGVGNPLAVIVNEPGMYEVVLRSSRPEALKLCRWITHDVLPALHRDGYYLTADFRADLAQTAVLARAWVDGIEQSLRDGNVKAAGGKLAHLRTMAVDPLVNMAGPDAIAAL